MLQAIQNLDFSAVLALTGFAGAYRWAHGLTFFFAELLIILPFAVLYYLWRRPEASSRHQGNRKAVVLAVFTVGLALAIKSVLNFALLRSRPFVAHPDLILSAAPPDTASFPSGHTLIAAAIAFSLYLGHVRKAWILVAVAGLIGFGRVAAGVHYPTDVLGGLVIGWLCALYFQREASGLKRYLPNR